MPLLLLLLTCLASWPVPLAAQSTKVAETLAPGEQKSFAPGYAVGDIALGNPKVADFKVLAGRRELLLFGRTEGQTTLTVWDQRGVKRHEIAISVRAAVNTQIVQDLKALLQDFPAVEVRLLGGVPVVAGAVSSTDDLAAVEKIAAAASVRSLVRYVPATPMRPPIPSPAVAVPPVAPPAPAPGSTVPSPAGAVAPAAAVPAPTAVAGPQVEYEIELLEASTRFRSGSYATGVEPSGRRLFIGKVLAPLGGDGEIFIGGKSITSKESKTKGGKPVEQGIRLTLRPQVPDGAGRFKTGILIQTNLPIGSDVYDPETWRRARWEFIAVPGEPFGITGADLLAVADLSSGGGSSLGSATRGASRIAGLPGASAVPGSEFVPVFGSLFGSSSYKQKQTQLLVIIRPRLVAPGQN